MLIPTKHTDPSRNVLSVATELLEHIHQKRVVSFEDLREYLRTQRPGTDRIFVSAATLLYALGLIEYRRKTDAFEYTGPQ